MLKTEEVYGFLYYGRHRFFNRFRIGISRLYLNSKIVKKSRSRIYRRDVAWNVLWICKKSDDRTTILLSFLAQ